MIILDQINNIESGKKDLRNFGIIMAVALSLIGSYLFWKESNYYPHIFGIAVAFLLLGLLLPVVLKPVHKVWMTISILLGWVMTRLILSVLFYLLVTPMGLLFRLFGKRFLNTKIDKDAESYWVMREESASKKEDYERQF